jgi:hypothetical protein
MVGAGAGKGSEIALRLDYHQMNVEWLCRRTPDCLEHKRSDGDVGNETAVHYVNMDPVRTGSIDSADFVTQFSEVGR